MVFEKMKIKPADMELRMIEISIVTSSQEGRSQQLQPPDEISGGILESGRFMLVFEGM
jgi:hypothetical protein